MQYLSANAVKTLSAALVGLMASSAWAHHSHEVSPFVAVADHLTDPLSLSLIALFVVAIAAGKHVFANVAQRVKQKR